MNNTLKKRLMAFMNCPWKSTAGCNLICAECFRSDPDGLRTLLDNFNKLGEEIETKKDRKWLTHT